MIQREWLDLILFAVTRNGTGERMRGQFFKRISQPRDFVFAAWRKTFDLFNAQFSGSQRAGLVESDNVDFRQFFHRSTAPK